MSKNKLTDRQMSDAAYLDQAAVWSKDLTRMRARGPGDAVWIAPEIKGSAE